MKNYLVFQAYGKNEIKNECKFALLHLLSFPWHVHLIPVIYTDDPGTFKELQLIFEQLIIIPLTSEKINEWKGADKFVHRVKIEMLRDFLSTHSGNILYCDTDTYFIKSPKGLFCAIEGGEFFMHTMEGFINGKTHPPFKKWERFLISRPEILQDKGEREIQQIHMWNAGVIGLRNDALPFLEEVLKLTDIIYKAFPKHIAEQFAFSYILQKKGEIHAADKYIFHYWYLKEFGQYLEHLVQQNKSLSFKEIKNMIRTLPEELLEEKVRYERKTKALKFILPKWKINIRK